AATGALPTTNILALDVDSHAEGPTRTEMPCPSRATLARGRRVYPSATTRKVEPENFRARGRGQYSGSASRCSSWSRRDRRDRHCCRPRSKKRAKSGGDAIEPCRCRYSPAEKGPRAPE